jgi:hypothetical protein
MKMEIRRPTESKRRLDELSRFIGKDSCHSDAKLAQVKQDFEPAPLDYGNYCDPRPEGGVKRNDRTLAMFRFKRHALPLRKVFRLAMPEIPRYSVGGRAREFPDEVTKQGYFQ